MGDIPIRNGSGPPTAYDDMSPRMETRGSGGLFSGTAAGLSLKGMGYIRTYRVHDSQAVNA